MKPTPKIVKITTNQLLGMLAKGMTWLTSEDMGFGSIQSTIGANDLQIAEIRTHPKLKDAEPSVTIFEIIDDTDDKRHDDKNADTPETRGTQLSGTSGVQVSVEPQAEAMAAAETFFNI